MNLTKEIKTLRSESLKKAIFDKDELDALPIKENGQPDMSSIKNENVENVILNCLSLYQAETAKDGFYINAIANLILTREKDTLELKSKFNKFLIKVLEKSVLRPDHSNEGKTHGVYISWIISQVLVELGAELNENGEITYIK